MFPLLPALHETQKKTGGLTRESLEALASSLKIPVADLYSTITFYHYFGIEGHSPVSTGRCGGPVCSLPGNAVSTDAAAIACPGLCDQPVARYDGERFLSGGGSGAFLLPACVDHEQALFRGIRTSEPHTLDVYRQTGGYEQLLKVSRSGGGERALQSLEASGLTGRGGAAFPLGAKWRAVRDATADAKYVVCNADEGEPGTFKDRPILHLAPHLLLEAMALCGDIVGAATGFIYLRYEYPDALTVLEQAIREAERAGCLGDRIGGTDFSFRIVIRRGAGSYVCGEETALLNSLEGKRPWPRERPPFPSTHGLGNKPTVINNVETLCFVPLILEKGAEWFRSLGRDGNGGTKIYSVSGKVLRPGNYELPLGVTARELLFDHAGGPLPHHRLKAFTLGGISGGLLGMDDLDLPLDYKAPQTRGASLGSGGIIALDDSCCVVDFIRSCALFYESESCGKCTPCRIGTVRMREFLDGLTGRAGASTQGLAEINEIAAAMTATSACGLGQSATLGVTSALKWFGDEVNEHLHKKRCPAEVCRL